MFEKASWASYLDQEGAMSKLRAIRMMAAARNSWYDKMLQKHNKMMKKNILDEIPESQKIDPQLEKILKGMEQERQIKEQCDAVMKAIQSAEYGSERIQVYAGSSEDDRASRGESELQAAGRGLLRSRADCGSKLCGSEERVERCALQDFSAWCNQDSGGAVYRGVFFEVWREHQSDEGDERGY